MLNVERIRKDFPILSRRINGRELIYFDNNATTLKPIQVIERVREVYENHYSNIHRGVHTLSMEATELFEDSLREISRFINADFEELIPVYNASHGLALASLMISMRFLKPGDEVIVTITDHHSNMLTWRVLSGIVGFKVKYVYPGAGGRIDLEAVESAIGQNTKAIAFPHVSNVTGVINDVKGIIEIARDRGLLTVVDAAQSVPHMPVDVRDLGPDFLAFSGHKMLGPSGTGILYISRDLVNDLEPIIAGGGTVEEVTIESIKWLDSPWRYAPGTPNIEGFIGLGEAVRYLKRLGMDNVRSYEHELLRYLIKRLEEEKLFEYIEPVDKDSDYSSKTATFAFNLGDVNPNTVASFLDMHGIAVRSGKHCAHLLHSHYGVDGSVRASLYIYNTLYEIDRFIEALKEAIKNFIK